MQQTHTHHDCVCVVGCCYTDGSWRTHSPKAPLCQVCQTGLIADAAMCVCVCVWPGRWIPNNDTGTDSTPCHTKEKERGRRRGRRREEDDGNSINLRCPRPSAHCSPFNLPNNRAEWHQVAYLHSVCIITYEA